MAKPLIEGFETYSSYNQPMLEAFDFDPMSIVGNMFGTFIAYKIYKSVIGSTLSILFGLGGENGVAKDVINRIQAEPERYREYLIKELSRFSSRPVTEMTNDELVTVIKRFMEKVQDFCEGIPLSKSIYMFKKNHPSYRPLTFDDVENNGGCGTVGLDEFVLNHGKNTVRYGGDRNYENPGALALYRYETRASDAIRSVPSNLIGLYFCLVRNDKKGMNYYCQCLEKLITWSGTWRRKFDDVWNHLKQTWHYTRKDEPAADYADKWLDAQHIPFESDTVDNA